MLHQKFAAIEETRVRSKPHPQASAPSVTSGMYKIRKPGSKPLVKSWEHRFSFESNAPCVWKKQDNPEGALTLESCKNLRCFLKMRDSELQAALVSMQGSQAGRHVGMISAFS
ncbi:hypothetical protein K449DRAFT_432613 [Hypoxylon sp. EC38]|nr:hypothetical protein K449DRAFT_432613 [Hypoxylon sp. EC38]